MRKSPGYYILCAVKGKNERQSPMRPEQVKILLYGVGVLISVALYLVYLASARKRGKRTARPRRPSRAVRPNGASVRFVVGRAYWCRDKGWGDSAHQVIRRGERKALISCDVIEKRSDVEVWRTIRVVDGVETMERGNIRADDEYTGKRGLAPIYAAAKERRTAL